MEQKKAVDFVTRQVVSQLPDGQWTSRVQKKRESNSTPNNNCCFCHRV